MSYNYSKSDNTLKMQQVRMQLEVIAYSKIKREDSNRELLEVFSTFWQELCKAHEIIPENNFMDEFAEFEKESLLKFAPEATYINMEKKAILLLDKLNIDLSSLNL